MIDSPELLSNLQINRKQLNALNWFWAGFITYTLIDTLSTAIAERYHVNYKIFQIFQIAGIITILASSILLIRIKFENIYLKVLFLFYFIWVLFIFSRGFNFEYDFIKNLLFNGWFGIFPYFVPLIFFFPQNLAFYKRAFTVIVILGGFYVIYDAFFIKDLLNRNIQNGVSQTIVEYFTKDLGLPCGFLLLTYSYQYGRRKVFFTIVILLSIFFAIIRARRGLTFILLVPVLVAYIIYIIESKRKFFMIVLTAVLGCLLAINALRIINESSIFNSIKMRANEDSRTPVEDCFFDDMKTKDWIIGKGINGQYFCPDIEEQDTTGYRTVIETDYLNIILKGGIINLALLLLIAIPAVFKGLFFSKNILSKASGIWILLWIISLYPTSVNTFTMSYLLVWICIGICYNERIRNMPEELIRQYYFNIDPLLNES